MSGFLRVDDWIIRTHGISNKAQWLQWCESAQSLSTSEPVLTGLVPKSVLRRASKLTNLSLDVALELTQNLDPDYLIFASQHGEISRSIELLNAIARSEDLSPTAFSQSVHNTGVGLFTIIKQSTTKATAIAAGDNTIFMALADAYGFLKAQPQAKVLLVMSDEKLPEDYQRDLGSPTLDYSFGFVLSLGNKSTFQRPSKSSAPDFLPIPLRFLFDLQKSSKPNEIHPEEML